MQFQTSPLVAVLALAAGGCAHFVLQIPTSLGFDDALEATGPCGSFKPTDRSTGVTTWPVGGGSVGVLTTHTQVTWNFKAALLSDPANFVSLVHDVSQKGVGSVCFPSIPGNPNWVGQDAVLQVIQNGVDGTLYQCAAIKFAAGGPASVPGSCTNSTGVSAFYLESGGPPPTSPSGSPSSDSPTKSSSTGPSKSATPETTSKGSSSAGSPSLTSVVSSSDASKPTTAAPTGSGSSPSASDEPTTGSDSSDSSVDTATSQASSPGGSSANSTTTASPVQVTGAGSLVSAANFVVLSGAALAAFMIL